MHMNIFCFTVHNVWNLKISSGIVQGSKSSVQDHSWDQCKSEKKIFMGEEAWMNGLSHSILKRCPIFYNFIVSVIPLEHLQGCPQVFSTYSSRCATYSESCGQPCTWLGTSPVKLSFCLTMTNILRSAFLLYRVQWWLWCHVSTVTKNTALSLLVR